MRRAVIEIALAVLLAAVLGLALAALTASALAPPAGADGWHGDVCDRKPWKPECTTTTTSPAPTTTSTTVPPATTTSTVPTTTTWVTVEEPCQTCDHELPAPEVQAYPDPQPERLPVTGGNAGRAVVGVFAVVAGAVALWGARADDGGDR